jgi:hypothetical protein
MRASERSKGMDESTNHEGEKKVVEEIEKKPTILNRSSLIIVVVGLVMLVLGMFLGYYGRPLMGPEAMIAKKTATAQAIAVQTQVVANKQIMDYLSGKLQHFQGYPNAPVTIIEFSDFQ